MTIAEPQDERMWREALEHVLAVRGTPADRTAERTAGRWRALSPAHEAAYAEAERVWQAAGKLPPTSAHRWKDSSARSRQRARRASSRRLVVAGVGALVAAAVLIAVLPGLTHRLLGEETTGTAEIRVHRLGDGSRMTLGPYSTVRVAFDDATRRVELRDGMAFFEVAPGDRRPFIVRNDGVTVRALGTAFEAQRNGNRVSVSVGRGAVAVSSVDRPAVAAQRLGPGDWLTLEKGTGLLAHGRTAPDQIAIWREGMLVVDRRPIREVAAEIGRWHSGTIAIVDDALGTRRVSGIFDLRNPEIALEAVVEPHGGRVRCLTRWVLLLDGR